MKARLIVTAFFVSFMVSMPCRVQAQAREDGLGPEKSFADSTRAFQTKIKSPKTAVLRALMFPGLGQFYNEQYIKAGIVLVGQSVLVGLSFYYNKEANDSATSFEEAFYSDRRNLMYWLIGAGILISMLDAYIDAHLYNFDTGPELEFRIGALDSYAVRPDTPRIGLSLRAKF